MSYEVQKAFGVVSNEIDQKVEQIQEFLSGGSVKSFEEYQGLCGQIKGLRTAQSYIQDLTYRMESSDE